MTYLHWLMTFQALDHILILYAVQIAIHAIGDQANDDVLAMYSYAHSNNSHLSSPRHHRIEHVQHVSGPDAIAAFSQQQTVAVVNPLHLLSDMHIMTNRLGKQRGSAKYAFAHNAMLKVSCIKTPSGTRALASAAGVECFPPMLSSMRQTTLL